MESSSSGVGSGARRRQSAGGVSAGQRRVLEVLKRRGEATIPEMAEVLSLNVETVRYHLRGLESAGYVERRGRRSVGPGRPEVLYGLAVQSVALLQ